KALHVSLGRIHLALGEGPRLSEARDLSLDPGSLLLERLDLQVNGSDEVLRLPDCRPPRQHRRGVLDRDDWALDLSFLQLPEMARSRDFVALVHASERAGSRIARPMLELDDLDRANAEVRAEALNGELLPAWGGELVEPALVSQREPARLEVSLTL